VIETMKVIGLIAFAILMVAIVVCNRMDNERTFREVLERNGYQVKEITTPLIDSGPFFRHSKDMHIIRAETNRGVVYARYWAFSGVRYRTELGAELDLQ
jgi:hypothetical protein